MAVYNWQQADWPLFRYSLLGVEDELLLFSEKAGRVSGILEALPEGLRMETVVDIMLMEAINTSAIEGEYPNRNDVLSSIRKNLGIHTALEHIRDRSAEGLGRLMIDVRKTYAEALTEGALFAWHDMLLGASNRVAVGRWRTHEDPMQVVSGPLGREKVHFEAPPSRDVPAHMHAFIDWFNATAPGGKDEMKKAPVRAALAHLYFETIHPFEDGNGRIGRVIAEKALSQTRGIPVILSLSRTIESNKKAYYDSLEQAQWSNEVTPWVEYFVRTTLDAQLEAERQIDFTLRKARFFDRYRDRMNERQHRVIQRMLEEGPDGFKGGMNARKYMAIAKTSKATATRDMQQLLEIGVFIFAGTGGGRSTSYYLNV
jgi:Fic family protein